MDRTKALVVLLIAVFALAATNFRSVDMRIQNRWKPEQYLNTEHGRIESGLARAEWLSAQWTIEFIPDTAFFRIRNKANPDQYLHIEHGELEAGHMELAWWSAMWTTTAADSPYVRIRNRWKPDIYIHIQNGRVEAGPIDPGWWSAQWQFTPTTGPCCTPSAPDTAAAAPAPAPAPDTARRDVDRRDVDRRPNPTARVGEVDWDAVRRDLNAGALQPVSLPPDAIKYSRTGAPPPLPVLLSADPQFVAGVSMVYLRNSYAASGKIDDANVVMHGTRILTVRSDEDPLRRALARLKRDRLANGTPYALFETDLGINLTFGNYGAAYVISVACPPTNNDERCRRTEFIRDLAERMAIANSPNGGP